MSKSNCMREHPKSQRCYLCKNPLDVTMGNPQATPTELAWLAGIWDGEGSFQITRNGVSKYQARIKMTTTSTRMADRVMEIIHSIGINSFINLSARGGSNGNNKTAYNVIIGKLEEMLIFSNALLPYLVEKDSHARLLIRYVVSRLQHGKRHGKSHPYTEEEDGIVQELSVLNRRGASETKCWTPRSEGDDIVRTTAKSVELGRNDLATS